MEWTLPQMGLSTWLQHLQLPSTRTVVIIFCSVKDLNGIHWSLAYPLEVSNPKVIPYIHEFKLIPEIEGVQRAIQLHSGYFYAVTTVLYQWVVLGWGHL